MNHLANATSPYLKQHANNPVDWYPWGDEALEKARRENKPVLLSIGYAACHWCHVMAHESFEDEETANIMNKLFVNIKVDREERPDLDKIYQTTHYLLTQRNGGWPLTIFLTPDDLTPFYSGTYFPREARYQLPAFKNILVAISEAYRDQQEDIKKQNVALHHVLRHQPTMASDILLNNEPLKLALSTLQQQYDPVHGGFGHAPKFPQPAKLLFLLQQRSTMAKDTLRQIARGGIQDQLGGGFYRYSVDEKWQIPHFEKMLYDNGQLLFLYALAANGDQTSDFAEAARKTAAWAIDQMQSPEGGFYASIDADTEGEEGKYYLWDQTEVEKLLTQEEYKLVKLHFGLDQPPNFENHWHFYIAHALEPVAEQLKIPLSEAKTRLAAAATTLLSARSKRIPPDRDQKILTGWNALMIKGLLTAGDCLEEPRLIESGERAITFIQQYLWQHKRLLASYSDGKASLNAYLDDYAFLLDALLTSLQVQWNTHHLQFAIDLAETLLTDFFDPTNGGFFFTAKNHETLLYRPKTMMDEAVPSGNGIAVSALLTLGHLLGEARYLDAAEKTLHAAWTLLQSYPAEHASLLSGLNDYLNPPSIIVIRGTKNEINTWRKECQSLHCHLFAIPDHLQDLPPFLASKKYTGKTCAYVCQGMQCSAVIEDKELLKETIKNP